jgi:hypothetical protein
MLQFDGSIYERLLDQKSGEDLGVGGGAQSE